MKFQTFIAAIVAGLLTVAEAKCKIPPRKTGAYCRGTNYNQTLEKQYMCGDYRLGPPILPQTVLLSWELEYDGPYDGLCPGQFLGRWWDDSASRSRPGDHIPISGNLTLPRGTLIDRFGDETGNFASPYGAPYIQRALHLRT
ncbi:hypothetical protein B0H63DRAFT_537511 [Podospora didyma]|uniref:TNT domain-containing protein n=1 Tax=Podospora didyma TaxID=330526 RepID=A0AAE0NXJ7_9PEZI|nr:hypothetical protein B0H63DRAFT_537511 [Podospora didyma]